MFFSHALIHWSAAWIAERFPCWGPCWLAGFLRAWHLIGWRHDHQPVGGPVAEPGLACMDFDTGFLSNLGPVSLTIFLPAVWVRWKFRLAVIPLLAIRSQQVFAHATAAQLSCHVRNFVAITVFEPRWERSEVSIEFELRWGEPLVKRDPGPLVSFQAYLETSLLCLPTTTVVFMLSFGFYDYMGWWEGRCGPST